ncbi:MAG TPA: hypothetical protein VHE59_03990 [Mucilaginibacter sp.]|nr:hypothetical protein [Mucilaginibacter sp.]
MTSKNAMDETKKGSGEPNAYRVEDEKDMEEKDLKRTYLFGDAKMKSTSEPGMEGRGMGGQNFGNNNLTPAGNDKDNPPQNAGEGNAYFRRTQPAEEHPEDENFTVKSQQGAPGREKQEPNVPGPQEVPDQQKVGEDNGKQTPKAPNPQEEYREGTADEDGQRNRDNKD